MLHKHRIHVVQDVESPEELAEKLTKHTWCCCQGFRHGGYLYLNDSTGGDGAQEYAVFKDGVPDKQIESITFGWCEPAQALGYIRRVTEGGYDSAAWPVAPYTIDGREPHRCSHCA